VHGEPCVESEEAYDPAMRTSASFSRCKPRLRFWCTLHSATDDSPADAHAIAYLGKSIKDLIR